MASSKRVTELSKQQQSILDVLKTETELACVLIGTSYIDQCLSEILREYFIAKSKTVNKILDSRGLLGTISAKIDLAYSLGLISKPVKCDLDIIIEIRNSFAHSHEKIHFESRKIKELIEKLEYIKILGKEQDIKFGERSRFLKIEQWSDLPRDIFNMNILFISSALIGAAFGAKHREECIAYVQNYSKNKD